MTEEINIGGGVFIPGLMLWALVALASSIPVRWLLNETGFYRLVWHRGLFDICLFVILWGGTAAIASSGP
jgi:Protein of unknown function (DUF1656)